MKTRKRVEKIGILDPNPSVPVSPSFRVPISQSPRLLVAQSPRRPVSTSPPLITLLTDFGTADYFVSAMRGVILSINPETRVVDITHEIPPQDIEAAAFTLLAAYSAFPLNTIHVAVVDPGVGSSRRGILVEAGGHFFVGPDNGIFSYICEREQNARFFELTKSEYYRHPVSPTFHGRDVFAPVAAALTTGVSAEKLGKRIRNPEKLAPLNPKKIKSGEVTARIIHIDRFGNCITNLTARELTARMIHDGARLRVNGKTIRSFRQFFSDDTDNGRKPFAFWGSAGFLELAVKNSSAAEILKARRGDRVTVKSK